MPIYEYQCAECGKTFEIFQKMNDEPLTRCKVCKGQLTKLISNCAFHLKGTGWYVTDYKKPVDSAAGGGRNGSKPTEKTESTPASAVEVKSETKTESTASVSASTGGAA